MEIEKLFNSKNLQWLNSEVADSEVIISSRIRLARNLAEYPFSHRTNLEEAEGIVSKVLEAVKHNKYISQWIWLDISSLSSLERNLLVEEHLISREFAQISSQNLQGQKKKTALILDREKTISIMINEEDHLRMQVLKPGLCLKETWQLINNIDNEFMRYLDFAYDSSLGYLTACPTNIGTGLRASAMLHLPALSLTSQIEKVLKWLGGIEMAVRGWLGEGSKFIGDFYQISNQTTLGSSEEDIIERVEVYIGEIIKQEQEMRRLLLKQAKTKVEDLCYRAYGVLASARLLSLNEAMSLLSYLRLGISLGLLSLPLNLANELIIIIQPAHLQKLFGKTLNELHEQSYYRAQVIREKLARFTNVV